VVVMVVMAAVAVRELRTAMETAVVEMMGAAMAGTARTMAAAAMVVVEMAEAAMVVLKVVVAMAVVATVAVGWQWRRARRGW